MKYLIILISTAFIYSSPVLAKWFHFEPAVGYHQGHYQTNQLTGIGVDLKAGISWSNIFIVGNYGYAPSLTSSKVAYEIAMNNMGAGIGWEMKDWRLWYMNMFSSELSWTSGGNESSAKGSGHKFGIGGTIMGKLSLNLEINFLKYTEKTVAGTTSDVDEFMDLAFISFSWPY